MSVAWTAAYLVERTVGPKAECWDDLWDAKMVVLKAVQKAACSAAHLVARKAGWMVDQMEQM